MKSFRPAHFGLLASLLAWSGVLLAQGPSRIADDMGESTPRRHAPRRKVVKKKKPKGKAKPADAGAAAVAPRPADALAVGAPDAGTDAAPPPAVASRPADDDEEDDDDEEEDTHPASATADGGASPRPPRKRTLDGGSDAGGDADADDEDEDDDESTDEDEDTAYELGVEVATESRLVWRGLPESRGAVLQSSGWAGAYGFSVEGWASYLLNSEGTFDPMTVVGADLAAGYAFTIGDFRFKPEVTLLYFPEGLSSSTTAEASLGASYRLGGGFHVVSGANIDVSIEPGAYFGTFGLAWGRAKPPWTVKALADVGWASDKYNHEYLAKSVTAIDVVHAGVSARYDVGSVLYLELHVDLSRLVAPAISGSVQEPTLFVGGAAVGLDWSVAR